MSARAEIQMLVDNLLRTAAKHKVAVVGFAFSAENPMIINFSNTKGGDGLELYKELVEMCQEKRRTGDVIDCPVRSEN